MIVEAMQRSRDEVSHELFLQYQNTKDTSIRNQIYERYASIAAMSARRYAGRGIDYDDLFQVASLALLHAIERFDPVRGVNFHSFAIPTVTGEIKNYFRNHQQLIRVPHRNHELLKQLGFAANQLELELGRAPKASELAERLHLTEETILELLESANAMRIKSLDETYEDQGMDGEDVLPVGREDGGFEAVDNREFLRKVMQNVSETEKMMIKSRFFEEKSQREVAAELGISQMSVSRMEKRLLEKMKKMLS